MEFNMNLREIGVKVQDLTSGDIRWDAIYSIYGRTLNSLELPMGGSHPFFQPDWCPAPGDFLAHKYRLTISNLSQMERPEQAVVGEILFTQFGPRQLADTYAYENA